MKSKRNRLLSAVCLTMLLTGCGSAASMKGSTQTIEQNVNPEDFYVWSGNSIVGLTDAGAQQKELVIPEKCDSIEAAILYEKENSVESIRFEGDKDVSINGSLGNSENLKSITLPSNLSEIGNMEFWLCSSLEEIVIPGTVEVIGAYAFKDCTSLKKVVIQEGTTTISKDAFYGCSNLVTVELADSITEIADGAFQNCKSLTELIFPKNLKSVGSYAFTNCALEKLSVPEDVVLESYDDTSFDQLDHSIKVKVVSGSWMDQHFEDVFSSSAIKE